MLRRALSQSMHQLKLATSDAGAMVDRRIVTKLLLTWVERGRNDQSVLNLMARHARLHWCVPDKLGHAYTC